MYFNKFKDKELSALGFGTMRLPQKADGSIDDAAVQEMVDYAIGNGINYFDTAYPYHGGESERSIGRALSKHERSSFYLATKYPGHQIASTYDPASIFEDQLKKCGVEYFDFYLLHNIYENCLDVYLDPKWNIIPYFIEQKKLGRIKHLGFSSHARPDTLKKFLDIWGHEMEFCQIQLNYLDWTLQDAKTKYELLTEYNIPVWVMEPVRGGKLAKLNDTNDAKLKALRPEVSTASWGFRFLQSLPNVTMVLSGMSNMEQMMDNVHTFSSKDVLNEEEINVLFDIAESLKNSVPCTACRYCCEGCPMQLDIPTLLAIYNDIRFEAHITAAMTMSGIAEDKKPSACIGCGKCAQICPQNIDIPQEMINFAEAAKKLPDWNEICRQREEAALKISAEK